MGLAKPFSHKKQRDLRRLVVMGQLAAFFIPNQLETLSAPGFPRICLLAFYFFKLPSTVFRLSTFRNLNFVSSFSPSGFSDLEMRTSRHALDGSCGGVRRLWTSRIL